MPRRFRLATLERLRGVRLDTAARELAAARRQVEAATAHRDALIGELAACIAPAGAGSAALEVAQARRGLLRERVETAAGELTAAEQRAAESVDGWTAARAQLRAVETLHARHRDAVRTEETRREQRLVDDLAGTARRGIGGAG
jgi:flagellar export protein FliJ